MTETITSISQAVCHENDVHSTYHVIETRNIDNATYPEKLLPVMNVTATAKKLVEYTLIKHIHIEEPGNLTYQAGQHNVFTPFISLSGNTVSSKNDTPTGHITNTMNKDIMQYAYDYRKKM